MGNKEERVEPFLVGWWKFLVDILEDLRVAEAVVEDKSECAIVVEDLLEEFFFILTQGVCGNLFY